MGTRGRKRRKVEFILALNLLIFIAFTALVLCGCGKYGGGPTLPSEVRAVRTYAEYDGYLHTIEVSGNTDGVELFYSSDGIVWNEYLGYTEPGDYTIYVKAGADGDITFETLTITYTPLTGISSTDITVVYDGTSHLPVIAGARDGDIITFFDEYDYIEVGEYVTDFQVKREYEGFYTGTVKVTIIPDLSGKYVGSGGVVTVVGNTMIVGGNVYRISYGVSGKSTPASEIEFEAVDGELSVCGGVYLRLADGERELALSVNGQSVYTKVSDDSDITVKCGDGFASIEVDGKEIFRSVLYNYCESVSVNCTRDLWNGVTHITDISADLISVELAQRSRKTVPSEYVFIDDGTPHEIEIADCDVYYMRDGEYTTTPPDFDQAGEFTVDLGVISNDCLPLKTRVTVVVLGKCDGVYCSESDVLEIAGRFAKLNGSDVLLELNRDGLIIDGAAVEKSDNGIVYKGVNYTRSTADLIVRIVYKDSATVIAYSHYRQMIFYVNGNTVSVSDDEENVLYTIETEDVVETVSIDGRELIAYTVSDGELMFVVGGGDIGMGTKVITAVLA